MLRFCKISLIVKPQLTQSQHLIILLHPVLKLYIVIPMLVLVTPATQSFGNVYSTILCVFIEKVGVLCYCLFDLIIVAS